MNICDNLGDHLVGNVYVKVRFVDQVAPEQVCSCVHVCMYLGMLHEVSYCLNI